MQMDLTQTQSGSLPAELPRLTDGFQHPPRTSHLHLLCVFQQQPGRDLSELSSKTPRLEVFPSTAPPDSGVCVCSGFQIVLWLSAFIQAAGMEPYE